MREGNWPIRKRGKFLVLNSNKNNGFSLVVADNDVIKDLKTSSENLNTRKSTNLLVGVFKKWAPLNKNLRTHGDMRGSRT